jgi:membrane protein
LGLIAILSFFLDQETVRGELGALLAENLPGAQELVTRNLDSVVRLRGAIGLVALAGLLWSGSAVFGALTRILDRTWEVRDRHAFHIVRARSLIMLVGVASLVVLSLSSTTLLQLAAELAEVERLGVLGTFLASGAGLLFEAAKNVFVFYLSRFASFDLVYGSLASVIILLFWVYISGFILILGAEFGAALGRQRRGQSAAQRDAFS